MSILKITNLHTGEVLLSGMPARINRLAGWLYGQLEKIKLEDSFEEYEHFTNFYVQASNLETLRNGDFDEQQSYIFDQLSKAEILNVTIEL